MTPSRSRTLPPGTNDLLASIDHAWAQDWTSPTVRALAEQAGVSTSTMAFYLDKLVEHGLLERKRASINRVLYRRPAR